MTVSKEYRFPVAVCWEGSRLTRASATDRPDIQIAPPPEFRGGVPGAWSPEELLVAAAASCYAVTLASVADRISLPLHRLAVSGTGHVTTRIDGRFGFVAIELSVNLETDPGREHEAEEAVRAAEERCIVAMALDVPVHVAASVLAAPLSPVS